jgi:hypothetical protein
VRNKERESIKKKFASHILITWRITLTASCPAFLPLPCSLSQAMSPVLPRWAGTAGVVWGGCGISQGLAFSN